MGQQTIAFLIVNAWNVQAVALQWSFYVMHCDLRKGGGALGFVVEKKRDIITLGGGEVCHDGRIHPREYPNPV